MHLTPSRWVASITACCLLIGLSVAWMLHKDKPKVIRSAVAPVAQEKLQLPVALTWYDGLIQLRRTQQPIRDYLPILRNGLKNTDNWVAHLKEVSQLTNNEPWGDARNAITEAIMRDVSKVPAGIEQAERSAQLFVTLFPRQPEALLATQLLWEQYITSGLYLHSVSLLGRTCQRDPDSPESQWLLGEVKNNFRGNQQMLALTEAVYQAALPVGHPKREDASLRTSGSPLDKLGEDIHFERGLVKLPIPLSLADLTVVADSQWAKLRGLEFQMRRYYLTSPLFIDTDASLVFSTDSAARLQEVANLLRQKIILARSKSS